MERNLCLVKEKNEFLTPISGLESCLLQLQLENQASSIKIDLSDVTQETLSSEKEKEDLLDQKDRLFKRPCLIKVCKSSTTCCTINPVALQHRRMKVE